MKLHRNFLEQIQTRQNRQFYTSTEITANTHEQFWATTVYTKSIYKPTKKINGTSTLLPHQSGCQITQAYPASNSKQKYKQTNMSGKKLTEQTFGLPDQNMSQNTQANTVS